MEPDPMKNFRRRNFTDTVERDQEIPSGHTKCRRGKTSISICYLLLIALISSSPSHLSANAQEIIVGKPFPSLQQKSLAPSPSPSSSPISPSSSSAVVTGSPRPRQIAGNEWTPLPNPQTETGTETETKTGTEIDPPKNSKNVLKATTDENSEPQASASAPQVELNRRIGEAAEAETTAATATETAIATSNSSKNNNSDSNNDLTSSATHYVGRQLTDPGFFSDNRPSTNVVNYQNPSSKNYAFAYGADDFAHQERRDGKVTIGEYTVALPDGRTQVVRYTSDAKAGFKADVSYDGEPNSQPGPGGKEPSYEAAPQQQQYFVSSSHPKTSGSSVKYSNQQPLSPSIAPQYEYIGPSPAPAYRQSRIKLHGHGHGGGGGGGGPSPSPQSYSPSQSPIFLSYPLKAQRPSVSPSLLYSKNQNSISIPNPSANPNPNVDVRIIDHHHYIDQHGNALTPSAGPPSPTPPSSIYESDPNYRYSSPGGQRPGPGHGPGPGPSHSPYILQSSPSVETINRGTPISFYPSAAPPPQSHSPSPSPNSLYYESASPSGIGPGGPTKITTILQRANTKLISHHNHSPHYGSSPSGAPPPEIPSPYKQIPHGYRAGPGPESAEEFEPEYITHSHYNHGGGSSKTGGKSKRILIHGPGGSPHPYGADSSNSNIRFKQAKPDAPLLSHTYSHGHSSGNHHDFSVGNGNSRSSSSGSGRSGKNHGKPKSNLVPIEFFKAGPATKPPVPASAHAYNYGGRGIPLLEEQSISQKQVYSPNTITSHFPSTYSPPLIEQGQELQPQTYFQAEDALSPSQAQQQQQQLQEQQQQQHQHQLKQSIKYSPLHPQGGAVSSSSSEEQQFHQEQQVIRYVPNPQEQQQYISEPQPDQQQQAIDVNIAPVKSSVASYTIGHLGVTPRASLLYSSTDPGIPVGRAVHPSVGGLVYLEDPNHIQHSQHSSSSSSSSGGKYNIPIIGPPSSYPGSSGSDELPDAGPTTRPTAKEQRKGVKEAISRLPFIPPFPPKTQTYKVGAPDFGDSVSYSSKPTSEEITSDGQGHYGDRDISSHNGDPTRYQHVQDLPSNTLSSHHDGSLRKYYVQKIDNSPSYVDSA